MAAKRQASAFSHIGICVTDIERSAGFYTQALGFELDYYGAVGAPMQILTELPTLQLRMGFFIKDALKIELIQYDAPGCIGKAERRPMNQLGITHLCVTVEDIDAIAERIAKFGGQVHAHTRVAIPECELMFCTDPNGVRIELLHNFVTA